MMSLWEGNFFNIQAGRTECLTGSYNDHIREVVVNRIPNHQHQSVFEHPNWLKARKVFFPWGYDLALIRLNVPYNLPKGVYNDEPINRICINSFMDFPKSGCLKNVYFSGYGLKYSPVTINPAEYDPKARLTWFQLFRTTPGYCKTLTLKDLYAYGAACYSQVLSHSNLGNNPGKMDVSVWNLTEVKEYPNTCPGDSGGPFVYYMRYDSQEQDKHNVLTGGTIQTGYRAILLTTLFGSIQAKKTPNNCDLKYWTGRKQKFGLFYVDEPVYYKPIHTGPMVYEKVNTTFFTSALETTATGYSPVRDVHIKYPEMS